MPFPTDSIISARLIAKAQEYLEVPSVVGFEGPFLDHVIRDFTALGAEVSRFEGGLVIKKGSGPTFLCHCDRPGLIVSDGQRVGYAAETLAGTRPERFEGESAQFAEDLNTVYAGSSVYAYVPETGGRIAYGTVNSVSLNEDQTTHFAIDDMIALTAGTPIAFSGPLDRSRAGYVSGMLDSVVSMACLRLAFEFGCSGTIIVTIEEELNRSCERVASLIAGDDALSGRGLICLGVTVFDDAATALAGAVILRRRDRYASFDAGTVSALETAAGAVGAPIIFKDSFIERENDARARRSLPIKSMGHTQIGAITAQSKGVLDGASLELPVFRHNPKSQSTSARALLAMVKTLIAVG